VVSAEGAASIFASTKTISVDEAITSQPLSILHSLRPVAAAFPEAELPVLREADAAS